MPALDLLPAVEEGNPRKIRLRTSLKHLKEDVFLGAKGILDPRGLLNGYRLAQNPVEVQITRLVSDDKKIDSRLLVKDPRNFTEPVLVNGIWRDKAYGLQRREFTAIRRTKNLRVTMGRDQWQRVLMMGDVGSGSGLSGVTGTATATTATTMTDTGAAFTTAATSAGNTGLQGHIVCVNPNASGTGSLPLLLRAIFLELPMDYSGTELVARLRPKPFPVRVVVQVQTLLARIADRVAEPRLLLAQELTF